VNTFNFTFAFIFAVDDDTENFWCWASWSIRDIQLSDALADSMAVADQMEQHVVMG
jgi:hypothetical protein